MANHSLDPHEIAALDQVAEEAKADLDALLMDPAIRIGIAEDGTTIAAARLTITLEEDFSHTACAGFAAFAIIRIVQAGESP